MTRRRLVPETIPAKGNRRVIDLNALGWVDEMNMLILRGSGALEVGKVTGLQRDVDGWITGEVTPALPDVVDQSNLALSPLLTHVQSRECDVHGLHITRGFLTGLLVIEPAYRPWPNIGMEVSS